MTSLRAKFGGLLASLVLTTISSTGLAGSGSAAPGLSAMSTPPGLSAKRDLGTSGYEVMQSYEEARVIRDLNSGAGHHREATSYEARTKLDQVDIAQLPEVSADDLKNIFEKGRDQRPLQDFQSRQRRPTWLYPDDGCFARAELVIDETQKNGGVLPMKVFVFGDLSVVTQNSPDGRVGWWYHVAPIIKSQGVAYVLDPSMDALAPIQLDEWVKRTTDPDAQVSICASRSYDPDSVCNETDSSRSYRGMRDEQMFLGAEWERVESLGRSPEEELGDKPPWAQSFRF